MPYSAFDLPPLFVRDGFSPLAEEHRAKALEAGFEDANYQGRIYRGTGSKYQPLELLPRIAKELGPIIPQISVFRLADDKEVPDAAVHADNTSAVYAGMLYLTPDENCRGGTAFWRHKKTGWLSMPTDEEMKSASYTIEALIEDWKNPDCWELVELVRLKFNRFVAYPSSTWHSRYPLQGWGSTDKPETARLTYNIFFDPAPSGIVYPR